VLCQPIIESSQKCLDEETYVKTVPTGALVFMAQGTIPTFPNWYDGQPKGRQKSGGQTITWFVRL